MEVARAVRTHASASYERLKYRTSTSYEKVKRLFESVRPTPTQQPLNFQLPNTELDDLSSNLRSGTNSRVPETTNSDRREDSTAARAQSVPANRVPDINVLQVTTTTPQLPSTDVSQASTRDTSQDITAETSDATSVHTVEGITTETSVSSHVGVRATLTANGKRSLSGLAFHNIQDFRVVPRMEIDDKRRALWNGRIYPRLKGILAKRISSGAWLLEFYMASRQGNTLKPTIFLTCGNVTVKKKAQRIIEDEGRLQKLLQDNDMGFVILVSKTPLGLSATLTSSNEEVIQKAGGYTTQLLLPGISTMCGSRIRVLGGDHRHWRYGTLGGLLLVKGQVMGLTAGHPFVTNHESPLTLSEDNPSDSDDDNSSPSEEPFVFNMETIGRSRIEQLGISATSLSLGNGHESSFPSRTLPIPTFSPQIFGMRYVISPNLQSDNTRPKPHAFSSLDWALLQAIPMSDSLLSNYFVNPTDLDIISINEIVVAPLQGYVSIPIMGLGPQSGYLHPSAVAIKVEGWMLEAQLITLDRVLPFGCSGAWVTLEGKLCGHIVMTRQDVPWAYMVPIAPILEDIKRELETDDVRLPTELDFASPLITSYKPSVNVDTDELCSRMTETPTNESPTASMSTNEVRKFPHWPRLRHWKPPDAAPSLEGPSATDLNLRTPNRMKRFSFGRVPSFLGRNQSHGEPAAKDTSPTPQQNPSPSHASNEAGDVELEPLPFRIVGPSADRSHPTVTKHDGPPKSSQRHIRYVGLYWTVLVLVRICVDLNETILLTAIPGITDRFSSLNHIGWYGSAYLLGNTYYFFVPNLYKMCSIEWVFLAGLVIFELGCLTSATANSSNLFIVGRTIAGIGASLLQPGMDEIVSLLQGPDVQPLYFSLRPSIVYVLAPIIGGAFSDRVSWRWCFYINLPIGGLAACSWLLANFYHRQKGSPKIELQMLANIYKQSPLAWAVIFYSAWTSLLLAVQWGGSTYNWNSWRILGLLPLGFVLLVFLVRSSNFLKLLRTAYEPILHNNRATRVAGRAPLPLGFSPAFSVFLYWIPIWFQGIKGTTALQSGIYTLPMMIGMFFGRHVLVVGQRCIPYYTPFTFLATVLVCAGSINICMNQITASIASRLTFQALFGVGVGCGINQCQLIVHSLLERVDAPLGTIKREDDTSHIATSTGYDTTLGSTMVRSIESLTSAVVIAATQSIFSNILIKELKEVDPHLRGRSPAKLVMTGITTLQDRGYDPPGPFLAAYNRSFTSVFWVGLAFSCFCVFGIAGAFEADRTRSKRLSGQKKIGEDGGETGREEELEPVPSFIRSGLRGREWEDFSDEEWAE